MAAAPINPSDLGFIRGSYGFQKAFPVVPGFEGSGTVVAAGPGLLPYLWLGKRVACSAVNGGTWAEYLVVPATACFPLTKDLSLEQGSMLIINPQTAIAFFEIVKQEKHAVIISNTAAGAPGRMILRLDQTEHVPVIHIVRRQAQIELLRSLGGEYILNNNDPDFYVQLQRLAHQLKATLILDPVGGNKRNDSWMLRQAGALSCSTAHSQVSKGTCFSELQMNGANRSRVFICLIGWRRRTFCKCSGI